jgi:hypothetical protein
MWLGTPYIIDASVPFKIKTLDDEMAKSDHPLS